MFIKVRFMSYAVENKSLNDFSSNTSILLLFLGGKSSVKM